MRTDLSERRRQQRLNRLGRKVIDALAAGATLHFMHTESGPRWRLLPAAPSARTSPSL
jgi:hypothetical protein